MKVTQELVQQALSRFAVLFPLPEHSKTPELVEIWYGIFHDMEVDVFKVACQECFARLTSFPLPADLNRFVSEL
ncbi:hypothetical protein [Chromobacterium amazonense]|nr:hypothetical protein [Chromobacterium amazonense]